MARTSILLTTALLALCGPVWGDPPAPPAEQGEPAAQVVPVAADTKVLEEKTLPVEAALAQKNLAKEKLFAGKDVVNAKKGNYSQSGDGRDQPNAMRLYGFTLQPGEKLDLNMKSENASKMWMRFGMPLSKDEMTGEVMAANRAPKPIRASHVSLKNVTKEPYKIIAMVYGEAGYAYKVDIVRSR